MDYSDYKDIMDDLDDTIISGALNRAEIREIIALKASFLTAQEKHLENLLHYTKTPFGAKDQQAISQIKQFLGLSD